MKYAFAGTVAMGLVFSAAALPAAGPKYDDPEKVDADYARQGEYTGTVQMPDGKINKGVQVIALGNGEFEAVIYLGGLPGDGWDRQKPLRVKSRKSDAGRITFSTDRATATLEEQGLVITDPQGQRMGTLRHVVRKSPTLGKQPPAGAVVLFDGTGTDQWKDAHMQDGLLLQGTTSKPTFGSHRLHIEFRLPYQPEDRGQARGNSGIYVQGRYEVQMLDSFGLEGKHNECGGIYSVKDPDQNMCFPPLTWQTYDIDYRAARFDDDGQLIANPRITVYHNGVKVHDDVELPGERSTTAAPSRPGPEPGPVYLQDHGCPVRYRNIWVIPAE